MNRRHTNKISISLLSALLLTGLVANPAQADHSEHVDSADSTSNANNVLVPIAVGVVLGSMLYHGHGHHYQYSKRRYGHYSAHHRHDQGRHGYARRGYAHNGYGRGGYGHKSHSSSYGGYSRRSGQDGNKHQSRRKH
jgi:hypothetical protein